MHLIIFLKYEPVRSQRTWEKLFPAMSTFGIKILLAFLVPSMGKTRDLFKKIRDTKGTFHAKMGTIKDRNGMDLTEAEDIKKRWQEYTELYKKDLHDPDNHNGVITHLEPDILECEVKWALGITTMNKVSGGDGILVELFQILKDDALNMPANLENSAMAAGLEKVSFHFNPKERQCQRIFKILYNCIHLTH